MSDLADTLLDIERSGFDPVEEHLIFEQAARRRSIVELRQAIEAQDYGERPKRFYSLRRAELLLADEFAAEREALAEIIARGSWASIEELVDAVADGLRLPQQEQFVSAVASAYRSPCLQAFEARLENVLESQDPAPALSVMFSVQGALAAVCAEQAEQILSGMAPQNRFSRLLQLPGGSLAVLAGVLRCYCGWNEIPWSAGDERIREALRFSLCLNESNPVQRIYLAALLVDRLWPELRQQLLELRDSDQELGRLQTYLRSFPVAGR